MLSWDKHIIIIQTVTFFRVKWDIINNYTRAEDSNPICPRQKENAWST